MSLRPPRLDHAFSVDVEIDPVLDLGQTASGHRRIIHIRGGSAQGPRLNGRILDGGADWQVIWADGTAFVEARYTIESDDGALIYVQNAGFWHGTAEVIARLARGEPVDRSEYYFRTNPRFETSHPAYDWMNRTIFIGDAARFADSVRVDYFAVA